MKDRRNYSRMKVNIPITLYGNESREIRGVIIDLSEDSLGISISKNDCEYIEQNNLMKAQFYDKFKIGNTKADEVVTINIIVVRIKFMGNTANLGCIVRDRNFGEYAVKRKFADYYNKIMEN